MNRAIWIILALGFLLRFCGVGFGLPELYHADEPIVVNHAMAYGTGDLNPHYFELPPLVSYLVFFASGIYFLVARAAGWVGGVEDFKALFLNNPTSFYLLARIIFGVILGTLAILLLYRLVRKHFSENHALLSSWFLATAFLHVRDSHYVYLDMPLLMILVGSFFPILLIAERGWRRDYIFSGILLGAAVATKYNGVFIVIPLVIAHLLREGFKPARLLDANLFLSAVLSLVTYSLLNPFAWLDFKFFFKEFLSMSDAEGFTSLTHHLTYSLSGAIGPTLMILSLAGLLRGLVQRERKKIVLASFVLCYYLVLCFVSQPYDRYVLPLLPFLVIFAADLLLVVQMRLRMAKPILWALAFFISTPSIVKACYSNILFSREDIRKAAREWIEASIPSGERIALDTPFFMPRLKPTLAQLEEKKKVVLSEGRPSEAKLKRVEWMMDQAKKEKGRARYEIYYLRDPSSKEVFAFAKPNLPYDVAALKEAGVRYVVAVKIREDSQPLFYEELDREAELVTRFSPYRDKARKWAIDKQPLTGGPFLARELVGRERNGQILEVYKLK